MSAPYVHLPPMKPFPSFVLMCITALACGAPCGAQEKSDAKAREEKPAPKKEGIEPQDKEGKRPVSDDKIAAIKERIEDLRRAGKNEEADKLQQDLARTGERKGADKRGEAAGDGPERLRHVHEAIEHLRTAGLKDQAQNLEQVAKKMRAELESQDATSPKEAHVKGGNDQYQDLRRELEQTREQMKQMMQELREVRALVHKQSERKE